MQHHEGQEAVNRPTRRIQPVADFMLMRTFMTTLSMEQKNQLFQAGHETTRRYLPRKLEKHKAAPSVA